MQKSVQKHKHYLELYKALAGVETPVRPVAPTTDPALVVGYWPSGVKRYWK